MDDWLTSIKVYCQQFDPFWFGIFIGFLTNVASAVFWFFVGSTRFVYRTYASNRKLKKFFGKNIIENQFAIVTKTCADASGKPIVHFSEIRAASYLMNMFSGYRKKSIDVVVDTEAVKDPKRTLISFGDPYSNCFSKFIFDEKRNIFFSFVADRNDVVISDKKRRIDLQKTRMKPGKDVGIILKIRNQRFPDHYMFVCAGIGEWGMSGAAWYLAEKWGELLEKEEDEFGFTVDVTEGSDKSAIPYFED